MTVEITTGHEISDANQRSTRKAIKHGLRSRCPNCGEGALFNGFLTVRDSCDNCGTELHHHRADDLPAYLVVLVVGHVVVGAAMGMMLLTTISIWWQLAFWTPVIIIASLFCLRPAKGAVVGLQWAQRMHGFGAEREGYDAS